MAGSIFTHAWHIICEMNAGGKLRMRGYEACTAAGTPLQKPWGGILTNLVTKFGLIRAYSHCSVHALAVIW